MRYILLLLILISSNCFSQQYNIVADGNSLVDGHTLAVDPNTNMTGNDLIGQLSRLLNSDFRCYNNGLNGKTTPTMISEASGKIDTTFHAYYTNNVLIVWEATNDICLGGASASQAYNNIVSYCTARKAIGWKIILLNVIPRTSFFANGMTSGVFATRKDSVNASLAANYSTFADRLIDVNALNLTEVDGTHLDVAGYGTVAALIKKQIEAIIVIPKKGIKVRLQ